MNLAGSVISRPRNPAAFAEHLALELGEDRHDPRHRATRRCTQVERLGQRHEAHSQVGQLAERHYQVGRAPPLAIQGKRPLQTQRKFNAD